MKLYSESKARELIKEDGMYWVEIRHGNFGVDENESFHLRCHIVNGLWADFSVPSHLLHCLWDDYNRVWRIWDKCPDWDNSEAWDSARD